MGVKLTEGIIEYEVVDVVAGVRVAVVEEL